MEHIEVSELLRRKVHPSSVSSIKDVRVREYMNALLSLPASMPLLKGLPGERPTELENAFAGSIYNQGVTPSCAGLTRPRAGQSGWRMIQGTQTTSGSFMAVQPTGRCDYLLLPSNVSLFSRDGVFQPTSGTRVPLLFRSDVRPSGRMLTGLRPGYSMTEGAGRLIVYLVLYGRHRGKGEFSIPPARVPEVRELCRGVDDAAVTSKGLVLVSSPMQYLVECFTLGRVSDAIARLSAQAVEGMRMELDDKLTYPHHIYRTGPVMSARITSMICGVGLGYRLATHTKEKGIRQCLLEENRKLLLDSRGGPKNISLGAGVMRICTIERILFPGRCVYPKVDDWLIHASGLVFALDKTCEQEHVVV